MKKYSGNLVYSMWTYNFRYSKLYVRIRIQGKKLIKIKKKPANFI